MKKILMLTLLVAICFPLSGCQSFKTAFKDNRSNIEKAVDYSKFASFFACAQILDLAVGEEDKEEKAKIIFDISSALATLSQENPTAEDIELLVLHHTPDKMHWEFLAQELGRIYENLYSNIKTDEDLVLVAQFINEISEGCKQASSPYLTNVSEEELSEVIEANVGNNT